MTTAVVNSAPQKLSPLDEIFQQKMNKYLAMECSLRSKGYYYDGKEIVVYMPKKYKTIMDDWTPSAVDLARERRGAWRLFSG